LGAISAAHHLGLDVGDDIAVTGFDNIPLAEHCHPPLTTIHQPIYQIGEMVCEMLIKQIRGEPLEEKQIILQPSLMVRGSTIGSNKQSKS
jgi:LacI family repressor for deo operon, udp, cdd, tsx, nupC, and nupG